MSKLPRAPSTLRADQPPSPTRSRLRGLSLIETLVSSAILSLGLSAVLLLFGSLNDGHTHQRLLVQALHVGESTMEGLLVRYADDTALGPGHHAGPSFGVDGQVGGAFFTTEWDVTEGVPIAGSRDLVVTVRWTERGVAKSFALRTVRT